MIAFLRKWLPVELVLQWAVWILSALILGLFDLYAFRFDPRRFMNGDYIAEVGTLVGLGIFIFAFKLVKRTKELKQEDEENSKLEKEMNGYVNSEANDNGQSKLKDLVKFMIFINTERRVIAYKERMANKISHILEKLKPEEQREYADYDPKESLPIKYRRVAKLLRYQEQMTEEYIEKNKIYLRARFIKLSPSFMTSGSNSNNKTANENPAKYFSTAFKDNIANFTIPTIFVAFIIGSILIETDADRWAVVLIVAIKLILLVFQDWSAGRYAPLYKLKTWVHDLHLRRNLWERYFNWIIESGESNG